MRHWVRNLCAVTKKPHLHRKCGFRLYQPYGERYCGAAMSGKAGDTRFAGGDNITAGRWGNIAFAQSKTSRTAIVISGGIFGCFFSARRRSARSFHISASKQSGKLLESGHANAAGAYLIHHKPEGRIQNIKYQYEQNKHHDACQTPEKS